jgi:hypothetical protein
MDMAIWLLILVWLPMIWVALRNIRDVLTDILYILKKGGAE